MQNGPRPKRIKTVHAVHPNEGVREWYQRQLDELLNDAHIDLTLGLSALLMDTAARSMFDTVNPDSMPPALRLATDANPTKIERALAAWGKKWRLRFDKLSADIARKFAARNFRMTEAAMRSALKSAGFTVRFKPSKASIAAFKGTVAENVNLIRSIPQQYLTGVQSAVWSSVNRGADMASLSKALQRNYHSTRDRAALIARDQNAKAKATIENTRRQELGITQAIWQHSSAGKEPRRTHVAFNNQVFDLKRGMWDADEQEWVLPGQLINCRCTSRAIIPGIDEEA